MNWTDVSINKFNLLKEFLLDPENTDEERVLYQIQVLYGVNPYDFNVRDLREYIEGIRFVTTPIPKMKVMDKYKLGDTTYILKKKLSEFTVAQWLDWQHFIKIGSGSENYANLLSIFFFPEGFDDYSEGYDIDKVRHDVNEHLSIADAMAIASFFLHWHKVLLIRSLLYTLRVQLKTAKPLKMRERMRIRKEYWKAIKQITLGDLPRLS